MCVCVCLLGEFESSIDIFRAEAGDRLDPEGNLGTGRRLEVARGVRPVAGECSANGKEREGKDGGQAHRGDAG